MSAAANSGSFVDTRRLKASSITLPVLSSVANLPTGSTDDEVVLCATADGLVTVSGGTATPVGGSAFDPLALPNTGIAFASDTSLTITRVPSIFPGMAVNLTSTSNNFLVAGNNGNTLLLMDSANSGGGVQMNSPSGSSLALNAGTTLSMSATTANTTCPTVNIGKTGATNPALSVISTASSAATGVSVTAAAAGSGVAVATKSSGTNESITIDAKGSGTIALASASTGAVTVHGSTAATAGGALAMSVGSAAIGWYWGSGVPTITAPVGSLYTRTDGNSTSTRLYVSQGGGTWANVTTSA